ncbi:hypothetical protein, partial [Paraliomyxa miuraensis]|uniref:hypothetical protein n=1 Tax=Paraliomyxa miuraensis TaxID=376150 RepID=UPI00225A5E55
MSSSFEHLDRIDDVDTMREWAKLYAREVERLRSEMAQRLEQLAKEQGPEAARQLDLELALIREQMDALQRQMFGESSERRPHRGDKPAKDKKPQRGHGPK